MRAKAARFVTVLAVLALMLGFLPPIAPGQSVSAQADELTQKEFGALIDDAEAEDPIYGPEDGELVADPDVVSLKSADVEVADALIEATFVNPYAAEDDPFDIGIQFRVIRSEGETVVLRFIVLSSGAFGVSETGADELLLADSFDELDLDEGGENDLIVYADGDVVHFGINGDYVGSAEVSIEDAGDVAVGATFVGDSFVEDSVTEFTDFTIWELGGSTSTKKTPTPEEDEPTKESQDDDDADVEVSVYQSETWDFSFAYDESVWTVNGGVADSGTEYVTFQSDGTPIMNFVIGDNLGDVEECLTGMINLAVGQLENADIQGETEVRDDPVEIEDGPLAGGQEMSVDFTVTDGEFPDALIYSACAEPDGQDYVLGILQIVPADDYKAESKLREAVVQTINDTGLGSTSNDDDDDGPRTRPLPRKTTTIRTNRTMPSMSSSLANTTSFSPTILPCTPSKPQRSITAPSSSPSQAKGLSVDIIVADIFEDDEACLAGILNVGVGILEGVGIEGDTSSDGTFVIEDGTHQGATAAEIDLTPSDDSMPPVSIYIECGPVGNSDYRVGILQIMDPANTKTEGAARQAIIETFNNVDSGSSNDDDQTEGDDPKPTKTPKSSDDDNGKGGEKVTANVVTSDDGGALYTSPSYGFQVGILPGYTVEEDSVQNGYDTLVVADDSSRVTYSMFLEQHAHAVHQQHHQQPDQRRFDRQLPDRHR